MTSWATKNSTEGTLFRSKKYTNFGAITDDLAAGNLEASFILAPLAMVLARTGKVPVKICHLGHRDGTALVVLKDSPYQDFGDLRGKRIAIPHQYSNQRILIERLKDQYGFSGNDVTLLEMPPPEMPAALKAGQFDAYIVGEPFCAKAEMDGFGRVLAFTKDIWPNFISCVLCVTQKAIDTKPDLVRELVQSITASGEWIDSGETRLMAGILPDGAPLPEGRAEGVDYIRIPKDFGSTPRMQAALIASQKQYYSQDPELLKWVLSKPADRVKYTNLNLAEKDFAEIQKYAERLGYFSARPVTPADPFGFADYCDTRFEVSGKRELPLQDPK